MTDSTTKVYLRKGNAARVQRALTQDGDGAQKAAGAQTPIAAIAKTVAGQRHISPPGRHSQQTHRRAAERAATEGHSTQREQYDHDRNMVLARLQKTSDGV